MLSAGIHGDVMQCTTYTNSSLRPCEIQYLRIYKKEGDGTNMDLNQISRKILSLINSHKPQAKIIADIVVLIREETHFESVGLRLEDGIDFPYYFTNGFSQDFVEKEMYLCARDQVGELIRDSNGDPYLECMCGNVIAGRTDPALPFFTEGGSFWTNSTTHLLAETSERERQSRTRNRCNGEGYESVALVPVRHGENRFGILQLNDRKKNMFTPELVYFLEGIGSSIALLFSMVRANQFLRQRADDVNRLVEVRVLMLERIAAEVKNLNDENKQRIGSSTINKLHDILLELDTLKGIMPMCLHCKKVREDSGYWERIEQYLYNRTRVKFSHTYCPECHKKVLKELDTLF